jgi:hypothetical protein
MKADCDDTESYGLAFSPLFRERNFCGRIQVKNLWNAPIECPFPTFPQGLSNDASNVGSSGEHRGLLDNSQCVIAPVMVPDVLCSLSGWRVAFTAGLEVQQAIRADAKRSSLSRVEREDGRRGEIEGQPLDVNTADLIPESR